MLVAGVGSIPALWLSGAREKAPAERIRADIARPFPIPLFFEWTLFLLGMVFIIANTPLSTFSGDAGPIVIFGLVLLITLALAAVALGGSNPATR